MKRVVLFLRARRWPALATCSVPVLSWAHEGHGLPGPHWHATDVWGFVAVAAAAVVAVWFIRRK